ncbi:MAG: nucleotide sugar dehydrogenase, partial [Clostridia bacterium]
MPEVLELNPPATPSPLDRGANPSLATVALVGLGYVGLPVAVAFGRQRTCVGYDLSKKRIQNLQHHVDATGEVSTAELMDAKFLRPTADPAELAKADFIIVAVPTPINSARQPDFSPLESASEIVGRHMKPGVTVVYESTVYPGATEEVCVPILEKFSGMRWRQDFHVGYSPERINPGDKEHCFTRIRKVVSGDDAETLEKVAELYGSVVEAGVYRASSIRVAEAAKVIENTQRDLNIAFVNELSIIFEKLGLDTMEVLKAAGTKWNFLNFRPGLVGGHCIGVDPYYLTHKAELVGYHPEVILAGRRINDSMGQHIARKTVQQMIHAGRNIKGARVNVLGLTFKEDCPDIRNSKVVDIIRELHEFGVETYVHDPLANADDA